MFLIVNILSTDFHINYIRSEEGFFFKGEVLGKISKNINILYFTESNLDAALSYISSNISDIERLVFIKDKRLSINNDLYGIGLVGEIDYKEYPLSKPYLAGQITRILKNFRYLNGLFCNGDDIELLRLPFLNFYSPLLKRLPDVVKEKVVTDDFPDCFNGCLSEIRKNHRKPKRKSGDKKKYFIDDANKYFDLGDERHAHHETGHPHDIFCNLKAHLRLGFKLDERQHFNVSYDAANISKINGNYLNCHEEPVTFKGRVHLNIFTNDFIT